MQSDDSGLYYMRARYYNAAIKRFINQDTVTGSIESSQSLNRYAYVEGNPISYLDPFGLCPEIIDILQRVNNFAIKLCAGTQVALLGMAIVDSEMAPFILAIAGKIGQIQIGLTIADMSMEITKMYYESDKSIKEIVLNVISIAAAEVMSKMEVDAIIQLTYSIYDTILQEAVKKTD